MSVTFNVAETPRVYVERIDINGNTLDPRQGDPPRIPAGRRATRSTPSGSSARATASSRSASSRRIWRSSRPRGRPRTGSSSRSTSRRRRPASSSSRPASRASSGSCSTSRSEQRNFRGNGQTCAPSVNYSSYSKSIELGFTEPYLFDRNIAVGFDLFRRDYSSFNFVNNNRNTTYKQVTHRRADPRRHAAHRIYAARRCATASIPTTSRSTRSQFFTDPDGPGPAPAFCDPLRAGRYLCEAIGNRITSSIGYSLLYDATRQPHPPDARPPLHRQPGFRRPRRRRQISAHPRQRREISGTIGKGFIFSTDSSRAATSTASRMGGPGSGPGPAHRPLLPRRAADPRLRHSRRRPARPAHPAISDGVLVTDRKQIADDALGGRAYYFGRAELEIPLGSSFREMGLRPSVFVDVGALCGSEGSGHQSRSDRQPRSRRIAASTLRAIPPSGPTAEQCPSGTQLIPGIAPFDEQFLGDTPKPRLSVGFGVNWNSPFGPFRIDIAKALTKARGDDTKLITFNVGTAF